MATTNSIANGSFVQLNPSSDSPRAPQPSDIEKTVGQVRQSFTKSDGPYYQVVWNPGDQFPRTGLYHESELTPVTQQVAQQVQSDVAAGTYTPNTPQAASTYQQPNIPVQALPPGLGTLGTFSGTETPSNPPELQQTG